MYCQVCGAKIDESDISYCPNCGEKLMTSFDKEPKSNSDAEQESFQRREPQTYRMVEPGQNNTLPPAPKEDVKALIAMILGIVSIFAGFVGFWGIIIGIIAIILATASDKYLPADARRASIGKKCGIAGIIIGACNIIVCILVIVIWGVAIMSLGM